MLPIAPLQHALPHLGAAAAAAHLDVLDPGQAGRRGGRGRGHHFGQVGVFPHPAPVDPVLQPPHPAPLDREATARGDRVGVAGGDQAEPGALRPVGAERPPGQRPAQILRQRRPLPDREDAGPGPPVIDHRRHVAAGEHVRMRGRAQEIVDADEPVPVDVEPGGGGPGLDRGAGHPENLVRFDRPAVLENQPAGLDPDDGAAEQRLDPARGEDTREPGPGRRVVGRQQHRGGIDDGQGDRSGAPRQAVPHRKRELDPAGAPADDGDPHRTLAPAQAAGQRLPARDEAADRLDRHRVLRGARDIDGARRRADVDGDRVIGDRRPALGEHEPGVEVDPGGRAVVDPRAGQVGERAQVDMALVEPVMARDMAGQHA